MLINPNSKKSTGSNIFKGTLIILMVSILTKFVSFIAEAVMAYYVGTTYKSDAYHMIAGVHTVIYPMLSIGIWKVFLPLYKSHIAQNEIETADALANKSITFFTLISTVIVGLLIVFAPLVVTLVAPGFEGETKELTAKLVRISAPMYIFIIAAGVYASMLQCRNKFFGSQIRMLVSHIPTIIAAIFFYKRFGIEAMAIALVVSAVLRLLTVLFFVDWGYRFKPDFRLKDREFVLMCKRMPSALLGAGVTQLNSLVDKVMASGLPEGTISSLDYGHRLMKVFGGMISSAINTAMYPQIVELISHGKKDELNSLLIRILSLYALITFPVSLSCVLFRTEIASAVYERGAFNADSTKLVAEIFAFYCISLFVAAANTTLNDLFYAYGDTKTPMVLATTALLANIVFNLILIKLMGVKGLVLSTSLISMVNFVIRIVLARKYVKLKVFELLRTAIKIALCSIIACLIPRVFFWIFPANKFIVLIASAAAGVPVYYLLTRLLRVNEIDDLLAMLKKKLKKA